MNDPERLEALENLRKGAWRELDSLRNHEWKIAISIWSSLAALVGSILIHPVDISSRWYILAGIIIVCFHGCYILGVARNQKINRLQTIVFRDKIMSLLSIKEEYYNDHEIQDELEKIKVAKKRREKLLGRFAPFIHWSTGFQFWLTIFLVAVVIIVVSLPNKPNDASQKVTVEGSLKINGFPTDIQGLPPATPVKTMINSNKKGPEGRLKPRP